MAETIFLLEHKHPIPGPVFLANMIAKKRLKILLPFLPFWEEGGRG